MSNQDLFTALNMFKQGVGELALSRAISGANETVQQIKASEMNEQQQRAALQDISNQLVGRMAQIGAPATTIAQVAGAIGPKQFGSAEQMIMEGTLSGNEGLMQQGQKAQMATLMPQLMKQQQEFAQQDSRDAVKFQRDLALLQAKAGIEKKEKLSSEDTAFSTNIQMGRENIQMLRKAITRSGTWESRWGNTADSATLDAVPYTFAVEFSKIVDPNSVAREGEVKAAYDYLLALGPTSSKKVALAKLKILDGFLNRYEKARMIAKQSGKQTASYGGTLFTATQPQGEQPAISGSSLNFTDYLE